MTKTLLDLLNTVELLRPGQGRRDSAPTSAVPQWEHKAHAQIQCEVRTTRPSSRLPSSRGTAAKRACSTFRPSLTTAAMHRANRRLMQGLRLGQAQDRGQVQVCHAEDQPHSVASRPTASSRVRICTGTIVLPALLQHRLNRKAGTCVTKMPQLVQLMLQ